VDKTLFWKVLSFGFASACILTLALTGKIDGALALDALKWATITFLGGAALLGGAQAIAGALTSPPATPAPAPAPVKAAAPWVSTSTATVNVAALQAVIDAAAHAPAAVIAEKSAGAP
jgi:hypothetical protein